MGLDNSILPKSNIHRMLVALILLGILVHGVSVAYIFWLSIGFPFQYYHWGEWDVLLQSYLIGQGSNPYAIENVSQATAIPYNFLMQVILAPVIRLIGPELWVGRLFSIACYGGVLALIVYILKKKCHFSRGYILLGLTLAFISQGLTTHSFQKFHPNTLTILLGLLSFILIPNQKGTIWRWFPALCLALLSFFAKQPGLAFFAACMLYGFIKEKRLFLLPAVATILLGAAIIFLTNQLTNGGYWFYCFTLPSSYGIVVHHVQKAFVFCVTKAPVFFIFTLFILLQRENWKNPFILLALFSTLMSISSFSLWGGTETNMCFGLIALSITATFGISQFLESLPSQSTHAKTIVLLLVLFQIFAAIDIPSPISQKDRETCFSLQKMIKEEKGEVLALAHGLHVLRAGKKWHTSNEAIMQFRRIGIHTYNEIENNIASSYFSLIVLSQEYFDEGAKEGDAILPLLKEHYQLDQRLDADLLNFPTLLLRPKAKAF